VLVANLKAQGVKHVFGIPGAKIDRVYDALLNSGIETVVCRHEQNASFIAAGLGKLTGKPGCAWSHRVPVVRTWRPDLRRPIPRPCR
jgi:acetolactate synthase I/II/III large subunit